MAITTKAPAPGQKVGAWQELFEYTCTDRVKKAKARALTTPEFCLEHAKTEIELYSDPEFEKLPRIIQRAKIYERYLETRTVAIWDDELIVGNPTSKVRGSAIFGELYNVQLWEEFDDPEKDPAYRKYDTHKISDEERKYIREEIMPFFKGRTLEEYMYERMDGDVKEHAFMLTASDPHLPLNSALAVRQDMGHTSVHFEKILAIGLNGVRAEVEYEKKRNEASWNHAGAEKRLEFYEAALICIDASIAHAKRYADLALEKAAVETDPRRKAELEKIAEICTNVPANGANGFWEACQSVWFVYLFQLLEMINYGNSFGRIDQYLYPYYKQSVLDEKTMTRDEALELMELLFIKGNEFTELYDSETAKIFTGFPIGEAMIIGGVKPDGTDACNEVTMLAIDAEEQIGMGQPELGLRIWDGTPDEYIRRCVEVIRLGRGKPKIYGDKVGIEINRSIYNKRLYTDEDIRDYGVVGCQEFSLFGITQNHSFIGVLNAAKIMELALHNGKCAMCGNQLGPTTGHYSTFTSMEAVKQAYREQMFYWVKCMAKGVAFQLDCQSDRMPNPMTSCLLEGPIQSGRDVTSGGARETLMGVCMMGVANAGDALAAIDYLIYKKKILTWDTLMKALNANWEGYEDIREMCVNEAPKFGNDDDYADEFSAFVMHTWADALDWANTQKDLLPWFGGAYCAGTIVANAPVFHGTLTAALPDGHIARKPLADTLSPVQGHDVNGTTSVMKSEGKLPHHRMTNGTTINQRLNPQVLATDRDVDNFIQYLRTCNDLGTFLTQYNLISSEILKAAMETPEDYKDLVVRVSSYTCYFVELDEGTQVDVINRTEQQYI